MTIEPLLEITGDSGSYTAFNELKKALRTFCETTNIGNNIWVSLLFCNPDEMRQINKKYRGDDKTTDVLSFPAQITETNALDDEAERQFMGEILIDINYISGQTESELLNQAVKQVFIHGLLHLIGYDHLNSSQKVTMQELENKIMKYTEQEDKIGR